MSPVPVPVPGRGDAEHGIGRSRGGLSTKIHLVVDALGLPLAFEITERQRHDSRPASALIQRAMSRRLLADIAYDSDPFRACLNDQSCVAVIASNGSRAQKLLLDKELYEARSEIECLPRGVKRRSAHDGARTPDWRISSGHAFLELVGRSARTLR
jgi:transposase